MSESSEVTAVRKAVVRAQGSSGMSISSKKRGKDDKVGVIKAYESKQTPDEFQSYYGKLNSSTSIAGVLQVIEPPFNVYALLKLPMENNTLKQCIDAYVVNIESNGHRLVYTGPEGEEEGGAAKKEFDRINRFLNNINDEYNLITLRERIRYDIESTGNCYMEVVRNNRGEIVALYHVPSHTVRMTYKDNYTTPMTLTTYDEDGEPIKTKVNKNFRRFVQIINGQKRYFKEFGDPRIISPEDGKPSNDITFDESASEMIHMGNYTAGTPYGLPRWFNQMPSIMGSREAELTNLDFFQENAIPAMMVMVSGGFLTEEAITVLQNSFQNKGRAAQNRIAIVEATSDIESAGDDGKLPIPRIELKPLQGERQQDSLFLEYDKANQTKIRSSFRLPPIYLGLSEDYTKATAYTSMTVAESQVFGPERRAFDDFMNQRILTQFKPRYWCFKSMPPRIGGRDEAIEAVKALSDVGAITPNDAIAIANETLDMQLKPIQKPYANYPIKFSELAANQGILLGVEDLMNPDLAEQKKDGIIGGNPIGGNTPQPDAVKPAE